MSEYIFEVRIAFTNKFCCWQFKYKKERFGCEYEIPINCDKKEIKKIKKLLLQSMSKSMEHILTKEETHARR